MSNRAQRALNRFINMVERGGNALPHPAVLFGLLGVITLLFSAVGYWLNWQGINPANGELVQVVNLLSVEGLHQILLNMVHNYTSFAPLGIVMVALLGLGIAESSGLVGAAVNALLLRTSAKSITFVVVFVGIFSNMASDLGYLLIIPLAGVIFHSLGRHPIAGMSAAFAGVSGGFSANLLIGTIDPLLAGLSTEAAHILDPQYLVTPTANYYFMAVSTFIISFAGTWITEKWVEPRLGKYTGNVPIEPITQLTRAEKKGLKLVALVLLGWITLFAIGLVPENGFLRGADGTVLHTPLLEGFISVLFIVCATCGIVYGYTTQKFTKHEDVIKGMSEVFKGAIPFLVLVFFISQFVAWFRWSNLGLVLAINGANILKEAELGIIPLAIIFVLFSGFINLFMGSASAKWAIMGPVFIPIFMLLGYSPELSQVVYRIGDSVTNIISPMMSFFALIIVYYQKYEPKAGIGTLIGTMLPYSFIFFIAWTLLLIVWISLGIPLGPEAGLYYSN